MDRSENQQLHVSASLAEATLFASSNGLLASVQDNVAKPLFNAAVVEPWNAVSSSINDLSSLCFDKHGVVRELTPYETPPQRLFSGGWWLQGASTGIGTLIPLGATILATRGGLCRLAGSSETAMANVMRKQATATILGAGVYDGLRKPKEGETRLGNAIGGASAFGVFELGNHWSKNLTPVLKTGARMLTGAAGAATHVSMAELVSHGHLPSAQKYEDTILAGAVMNTVLPMALDRLMPAKAPGQSSVPETAPEVNVSVAPAMVDRVPANASGVQPVQFLIVPGRAADLQPNLSFGRMRQLAARDESKLAIPEPRPEQLITSSLIQPESIVEFSERVVRPVNEFRASTMFGKLQWNYDVILAQREELCRSGAELLRQVNARKFASEQLPFSKLLDPHSMRDNLRYGNEFRPVYEEWLVRRAQLARDTRAFFGSKEMQAINRRLAGAVEFLTDELEMPRLQVRLARMGASSADYHMGHGVQRIGATALFKGAPSELAVYLGHETAHGLQDYLIMARTADNLGIGGYGPSALARLKVHLRDEAGRTPSDQWAQAVLSMRNGRTLPPDLAKHAELLMKENNPFAAETRPLQTRVEGAAKYFRNPYVHRPVNTFFTQMEECYVPGDLFERSAVPEVVVDLQKRFLQRELVDTAVNQNALAKYFARQAKLLEDERYVRYRSDIIEQDAWGFERRIRDMIRAYRGER